MPILLAHIFRREWPAALERIEADQAYRRKNALPYQDAQGAIFRGSVLAALGQSDQGITDMQKGLAAQRAIGGRILQQLWLGFQVEACINAGRFEEAWIILEEAMTIREKLGDRFWEAELYRLKGELTLKSAPDSSTSTVKWSIRSGH